MQVLKDILAGPLFQGIGASTARTLEAHFGDELSAILDKQDARVLSRIITKKKAESVLRGWRSYAVKRDLMDWLNAQGIDQDIGEIAYRVWGHETLGRLRANPYRLLSFLDWREVDRFALKLGVDSRAGCRLVACVEAAAYDVLEHSQATWVLASALRNKVSSMLACSEDEATSALAQAIVDGVLIEVDGGYQVPGAYYAERFIEDWISKRQSSTEVEEEWLSQFAYGLSDEQCAALLNAVRSNVSVFHGAAGTGKTHAIRAICNACIALGERPILLALSARAARRLEVAAGFPSMTLAMALLRLRPSDLSKSIVVVDEFSMVDMIDFRRLLRKLPGDARLVLCGDVAQLPSIGPGRLLHSFVHHGSAPVQHLRRVFRQESPCIPMALNEIRQGKLPNFPWFDWANPQREGIFVAECAGDQIPKMVSRLHATFTDVQVISALNKSPLGAKSLNGVLHRSTTKGAAPVTGTPVVFTKNAVLQSGHEIINGLQGVVTGVRAANPCRPLTPYLCINTDIGEVECTRAEWDSFLEFGYVLTIHRAQGAEWDTVIAVLPKCRLLERAMVYTALSRCRTRCIVITDDYEAISHSVRSKSIHESRDDRLFQLSSMRSTWLTKIGDLPA